MQRTAYTHVASPTKSSAVIASLSISLIVISEMSSDTVNTKVSFHSGSSPAPASINTECKVPHPLKSLNKQNKKKETNSSDTECSAKKIENHFYHHCAQDFLLMLLFLMAFVLKIIPGMI